MLNASLFFTRIIFCLTLLLVGAGKTQCAPDDVGLITQIKGEAVYWNDGDQKKQTQVQMFMKVRNGDHFKIPPDSMMQLIYRLNGRQETWRGPATLIAGDAESRPEGKSFSPPEVEALPIEVTKSIVSSPIPLPRANISAAGVCQLRGSNKSSGPVALCEEDKKAIEAAKQLYDELRQKRKTNDFTPELYLISVLADYEQYLEAEKIIDNLLTKKPNNPSILELKKWVNACINKR